MKKKSICILISLFTMIIFASSTVYADIHPMNRQGYTFNNIGDKIDLVEQVISDTSTSESSAPQQPGTNTSGGTFGNMFYSVAFFASYGDGTSDLFIGGGPTDGRAYIIHCENGKVSAPVFDSFSNRDWCAYGYHVKAYFESEVSKRAKTYQNSKLVYPDSSGTLRVQLQVRWSADYPGDIYWDGGEYVTKDIQGQMRASTDLKKYDGTHYDIPSGYTPEQYYLKSHTNDSRYTDVTKSVIFTKTDQAYIGNAQRCDYGVFYKNDNQIQSDADFERIAGAKLKDFTQYPQNTALLPNTTWQNFEQIIYTYPSPNQNPPEKGKTATPTIMDFQLKQKIDKVEYFGAYTQKPVVSFSINPPHPVTKLENGKFDVNVGWSGPKISKLMVHNDYQKDFDYYINNMNFHKLAVRNSDKTTVAQDTGDDVLSLKNIKFDKSWVGTATAEAQYRYKENIDYIDNWWWEVLSETAVYAETDKHRQTFTESPSGYGNMSGVDEQTSDARYPHGLRVAMQNEYGMGLNNMDPTDYAVSNNKLKYLDYNSTYTSYNNDTIGTDSRFYTTLRKYQEKLTSEDSKFTSYWGSGYPYSDKVKSYDVLMYECPHNGTGAIGNGTYKIWALTEMEYSAWSGSTKITEKDSYNGNSYSTRDYTHGGPYLGRAECNELDRLNNNLQTAENMYVTPRYDSSHFDVYRTEVDVPGHYETRYEYESIWVDATSTTPAHWERICTGSHEVWVSTTYKKVFDHHDQAADDANLNAHNRDEAAKEKAIANAQAALDSFRAANPGTYYRPPAPGTRPTDSCYSRLMEIPVEDHSQRVVVAVPHITHIENQIPNINGTTAGFLIVNTNPQDWHFLCSNGETYSLWELKNMITQWDNISKGGKIVYDTSVIKEKLDLLEKEAGGSSGTTVKSSLQSSGLYLDASTTFNVNGISSESKK